MAFILTLTYIAFALLSPSVLPDAIVSLHVNEILGVFVIVALIPSLSGSKIGTIPDSYLVLGLLLATAISILATGWITGAINNTILFLPILLVFYFVLIACRSLKRLRWLVFVLLGVALFIFAQGAIAARAGDLLSPYLEAEFTPAGVIYRYRGLGVLSDPNDLAQLFTMIIPLLWLRWKKGHTGSNFFFTILPALILASGLYFTHSRGGLISLIAVCIFGFKDKLGVVKSSVLAGLLFVGLMALNISGGRGINDDDGGRVAAWITGLEVFKTHPVFGIGFGNFGDYNETGSTAHNSYVLCLAETGLVGYFFWMGTLVAGWSGLTQIVRSQSPKKAKDDASDPDSWFSRNREPMVLIKPMLVPAEAGGGSAMQARSNAMASYPAPFHPASGGSGKGSSVRIGDSGFENVGASKEDLVYAAKIIRIAFVGLLTSSYFLSRSFSMVFYLLLGMAAVTKLIFREEYPELVFDYKSLFKKIWIVMAASVILLYVFVRVRGIH